MVRHDGAERYLPEGRTLTALREASAQCRGCDLYADATRTVFGEGRGDARVVLVGEVPGDREDREGHPSPALPVRCSTGRSRRRRSTARPCT